MRLHDAIQLAHILSSNMMNLISSPQGDSGAPLKALLFDSWYDHYRGVICLVAILGGSLKKGETVQCILVILNSKTHLLQKSISYGLVITITTNGLAL